MKKLKKAFTLTELVIVIAVIAILAAVLIPTYTSLVRKANISADKQTCKNMNTIVTAVEADCDSMEDVVNLLIENKYKLAGMNPTTEGYRFVWDKTSNQILLLNEKYEVVSHTKEYDSAAWELWLTVESPKEIVNNQNILFNYYLANDYTGNFEITSLSSFAMGDSRLNGNLTITNTNNGTISIDGVVNGTLTVNTPGATVNQYGAAEIVNIVAVSNNTFNANGFVKTLNVNGEGNVKINPSSYVGTVNIGAQATSNIVNNGVIGNVAGTLTNLTNTSGYIENIPADAPSTLTNPSNFSVQIGNLTQLEGFRDAVNNGATYEGLTVQLTDDITLENGWTPIGEYAREASVESFAGTFDGNNKTISNLNNIGYTPNAEQLFTNSSTLKNKKEYVYGFFGIVTGATIKNLTLTEVNIDIQNGKTVYGDKVGIVVGFSYGPLTLDNVKVTNGATASKVSAYDGVGGLVGATYSYGDSRKDAANDTVTINNCSNAANVNAAEKGAGILGFTSNGIITVISNTTNTGNVTVGFDDKTANDRAQAAGICVFGSDNKLTLNECRNSGSVTVTYSISTNVGAHGLAINNDTTLLSFYDNGSTNSGTVKVNGVAK